MTKVCLTCLVKGSACPVCYKAICITHQRQITVRPRQRIVVCDNCSKKTKSSLRRFIPEHNIPRYETATGRFSSSTPNVCNIPQRNEVHSL